ncbi:hypothetical protein DERF_000033 [Dermatophagoides farinae]|uniref:Uncharacterized protein n=1 Tax=Dermatophagoides farinae TaxID=6954 RepID=A0A922I9A6_DERFA|nr:hypothetical protein DERF_000033 [Dermatophagoides farinae]
MKFQYVRHSIFCQSKEEEEVEEKKFSEFNDFVYRKNVVKPTQEELEQRDVYFNKELNSVL